MRFIIIGDGVAGDSAAMSIRQVDQESEIFIFTDESIPFYYRPRLIDVVSGEIELNRIIIHNQGFYKNKNIKLFLSSRIKEINTKKNFILTESGEEFTYDKLLIAAGAHPFIPPISGSDKDGVIALRDAADLERIQKFLPGINKVIMIGGGLLGLETGNAFLKQGKQVSVIEFFNRLLPRQLDGEGASILKSQLELKGLSFFLDEVTEEITGSDQISGIKTKSGKEIPGELVVISAGVRSNLDIIRETPIKINKAITVNEYLQTSVSNIYAAGDCAEVNGRFYGIYPPSMEQGKAAGFNIAGKEMKYEDIPTSHKLKVVGIDLFCVGKLDMENKLKTISYTNQDGYIYKKAFLEDDKIVGAMLLGNLDGASEIEAAILNNSDSQAVENYFKEK
ncbi:NAD(P)/FAD-dependent oxidoreductase [Candidatus Dependentiae bacterium]|nr:NAD(P)/FAD-dependent oxidoreductase [Candidatus Dependentiae bacterium]